MLSTTVATLIQQKEQTRQERMDEVEELLLQARLNDYHLNAKDLNLLNDYILRDELLNKHVDKVSAHEYPILSDTQLTRRSQKESLLTYVSSYGTDGQCYRKPLRKKRTIYENWLIDDNTTAQSKTRSQTYASFTAVQPIIQYTLVTDVS